MSDISQGSHVKLILQPGDVYRLSTAGVATVVAAYGAPAGTTTITANTQDFGPYQAPAKLVFTATTGTASYRLLGADTAGYGDAQALAAAQAGIPASVLNAQNALDLQLLGSNVYRNGSTGPDLLRNVFAKALGGKRARIGVYPDSTGTGAGAGTPGTGSTALTNAKRRSFPSVLATALAAGLGVQGSSASIVGNQAVAGDPGMTYSLYNPDQISTGGFATDGSLPTIGSGGWLAAASGAKWSFTPRDNNGVPYVFDTFDILTPTYGGGGTLTVDADGTAPLTGASPINEAGSNDLVSSTFTIPRAAHTINLTAASATQVFVFGCIPYDSALGGIDIIQMGQWGRKMGDLALSSSPWQSSSPVVHTRLKLDLLIVQMTINDSLQSTAVATYATQLATVVNAAAAQGVPVLLMSGIPSNPTSAALAVQQAIVAQVAARAITSNLMYLDMFGRLTSYAALSARGWMYDNVHGNALLYADEGRWIAESLIRLSKV